MFFAAANGMDDDDDDGYPARAARARDMPTMGISPERGEGRGGEGGVPLDRFILLKKPVSLCAVVWCVLQRNAMLFCAQKSHRFIC